MRMRKHEAIVRALNNTILVLMLCLTLQASVAAQVKLPRDHLQRSTVITWETYSKVLDTIFPRSDPDPSKTVFELILRFRPSSQATSQIVIRNRGDKTELIEYTSPDGNIFERLNEMLDRGGKEDVTAMARSIKVARRDITIPETQMKSWYDGFFDALAATDTTLKQRGEESLKTRSVSLVLDGTTYDIWYREALTEISLTVYDVEINTVGSDGELKLVQWMNSIRREVSRLK